MSLFGDLVPTETGGNQTARRPSLDPQARDYVIRTVLGEAGAEPEDGQAGVAAVIRNRRDSGKYGPNAVNVVLAPGQFEPWMTAEGRQRMMQYPPDSPAYQKAAAVVDRVFGEGYDPTGGSTHFFSPSAQSALGRQPPKWAQGEPTVIGRHNFYAPEGRVRSTEISAQSKSTGLFDDLLSSSRTPPATSPPATAEMPDTGGRFSDNPGQNFRTTREGVSELAPPKTSAVEAAARGAATGVTANFYDELRGLMEAGGLNPKDPASLSALLSGAYKYWTGDAEAAKRYEAGAGRERELTKRAETDQPVASIAGNIAGGIALPLGTAARGATLADRTTQGARVGAAIGGLSGVGAGEDTAGRLAGAATGTAAGAVIGAAAPAAIETVAKAGQGVSRLASPIVQAVRGVRDPEAEAARRVTGALSRDVQNNSAGLTPAQFAGERAAGTPVTLADMGGTATRSLARSAADTSAEGRAALEAVTSERYITQNPRVAQFVKETFDFPDVGAKLDQIHAAARRANAPAYNKAYREGSGGIWDEGLEQFSQAPVMQGAIRTAFLTARNKAAVDGFPPIKNPFELNKATGVFELKANPDGSRALPNLQFWDHVKRNLDKVNSPESRAAAKALRDHLDDVVPSYKDARQGAASWFGAEDALEAGAKFATMGGLDAMKIAQARAQVAKMSGADRKLFETGFVSNLLAKIESRQDGQDIVKAVFNSPFARKQAEIALGPERAGLLEARLQTERVMNALKNEISGNSSTARRLYELGMAGATNPYTLAGGAAAASSYATGSVGPGDAFAAGLVFAARKGQIKIDERIARRVGEMLASNDAGVVTKGLRIVARNENLKQALRTFEVPAARVSGQQSSGIPAIQAAGIGRAENDQPQVQGP